jgi:hypothetical protein
MKPDQRCAHGAITRRARRMFLSAAAATLAAGCGVWPPPAHAVGARVDLQVVDRETGAVLGTYSHGGQTYVAGRPGSRYAIRVTNRTGARVLAVMSVDGVNIVSGQTASWNQGGYVLSPWQSYDITGWRKSDLEVAAFEFTSLPDSYAARTGRPHDVGVIGVAVFDERIVRPAPAPPAVLGRADESKSESDAGNAASEASLPKAAAQQGATADAAARAAAPQSAERLGTGHGVREHSHASVTTFVRRSSRPVEVVSIQYDRWENLVRAGVIPQVDLAQPRPFPQSARSRGFVPDPPAQ